MKWNRMIMTANDELCNFCVFEASKNLAWNVQFRHTVGEMVEIHRC